MSRKIECVLASVMPVCLLALALSAPSARAAVYSWDFTINPTAESPPMVQYIGDPIYPNRYTGSGGFGVGAGLVCGIGEFGEQNANPSLDLPGDYGFVYNTGANTPFTAEFKIKVLLNVDESEGRAMSFCQGDGNGRGIRLRTGDIAFVGNGNHGTFSLDLTQYQLIRLSVPNTGGAAFYFWNGTSWTGPNNLTGTMGGTGIAGELSDQGVHSAFELGSLAGSSTQTGKFQIDYLRIDNTQALTTEAPLEDPTAEPAICVETVTPTGSQAITAFPGGPGAALPQVLHSKGTPGTYWYRPILHPTYTIVSGDRFVYDIYTNNASPYQSGSVDIETTGGSLRDSGIKDQNSQGGHPGTNIGAYAYHTWYHREFNLDDTPNPGYTLLGASICNFEMAHDGSNPSPSEFFVRNVKIMNGTTVKLVVFDPDTWVTDPDATGCSPSNNGYTNLLGPQIDPDPTETTLVNYTITNSGNTEFGWTASVVKCDGTAPDYTWLSVSPTASITNLVACATAPVVATVDTTSLAAGGSYQGYVKFTSTCPVSACLDEPFTYPNANDCGNFYSEPCLVGQGGWTSTNPSDQIQEFSINGGTQLRLNGGGNSDPPHHNATHAVSCTGTVISVKVDVKLGGFSNPDAYFWSLLAHDAAGNELGRWLGTQSSVDAISLDGVFAATSGGALTGSYRMLEMRINTGCRTTGYYVDGSSTPLVTYAWGTAAAGAVADVQFRAIQGRATSATDYVYLDNLLVSGSNDVIREIDLNVLGCAITVLDPRIRIIGQCPDTATTTEEFTIKNTGAFPWTTFGAVQETGAGDSQHRPWLNTVFAYNPSPGPVAVGGTATVTATINWNLVSVSEGASILFSATGGPGSNCDGTSVFDKPEDGGLNTIVLTAPTAPGGFKILYNGNKYPGDPSSAGAGYKFALDVDTLNDSGTIVGDPDASDGQAYKLVDTTNAGDKTKWRLVQDDGITHAVIDPNVGATIVARVKTTSYTNGDGNTPFQANLKIFDSQVAAAAFWGGQLGQVAEVNRAVPQPVPPDPSFSCVSNVCNGGPHDSQACTSDGDCSALYHIIRMTSQNLGPAYGTQVRIYLDENPAPVVAITGDSNDGGGDDGLGFGADRSTAAGQTIFFDWITGTNQGVFAPGEEDDCIGSLIPPNPCAHPANVSWADTDHDGDVDLDDWAVFQICYTGPDLGPIQTGAGYDYCACMDRGDDNFNTQPDFDGDIDQYDFNAFNNCYTGPTIPWTPVPECNNSP